MVKPHIHKMGEQVMCYGRPMYIVNIQRGVRHDSAQREGIHYGVAFAEHARKPSFVVHESQVWETQPIQLVK